MPSPEALYALYLVDPGQDRAAVFRLIQEALGEDDPAEYLREFPSLISFFETEGAARSLADRFRDVDAVAVVRPADRPLAPAPVEEVDLLPAQRLIRRVLFVLGFVQIGVSGLWLREGHPAAAFFGLLLGLYVVVYFGARFRR